MYEKEEFESYEIDGETDITFCLKEFKACLLFGSAFDLTLSVLYERRGRLGNYFIFYLENQIFGRINFFFFFHKQKKF